MHVEDIIQAYISQLQAAVAALESPDVTADDTERGESAKEELAEAKANLESNGGRYSDELLTKWCREVLSRGACRNQGIFIEIFIHCMHEYLSILCVCIYIYIYQCLYVYVFVFSYIHISPCILLISLMESIRSASFSHTYALIFLQDMCLTASLKHLHKLRRSMAARKSASQLSCLVCSHTFVYTQNSHNYVYGM